MPWVNRLTDAVRESVGLEHGVALPVGTRCSPAAIPTCARWRSTRRSGLVKLRLPMGADADAAREWAARSVRKGLDGSMPSAPDGPR